jgi:hypothetical protein
VYLAGAVCCKSEGVASYADEVLEISIYLILPAALGPGNFLSF